MAGDYRRVQQPAGADRRAPPSTRSRANARELHSDGTRTRLSLCLPTSNPGGAKAGFPPTAANFHAIEDGLQSIQSGRSLPRTRLFHCVGWRFSNRGSPSAKPLVVEIEIPAEFYSILKQPTFVSTNDIIWLDKCHKVSPIILAVSCENHEILICPVSVTACGCYSTPYVGENEADELTMVLEDLNPGLFKRYQPKHRRRSDARRSIRNR